MTKVKKIGVVFVVLLIGLFLLLHFWSFARPMKYGVTFNYEYAQSLGLDPRKAYLAIFDRWNFKKVRISAQWNMIEKIEGKYDFQELDWMLDQAQKNGAKVVLAVGQKTPRWPECHDPDWVKKLSDAEYRVKLLGFMEKIFMRYKNHPALEIWQIENEPFLSFGSCRPFTKEMLQEELALVKKIDSNHSTLVTDSGELSTWRDTATAGDLFGTTLYRVVWNRTLGYVNYDFVPPVMYRLKLLLNSRSPSQAFVAELQAEPWIPDGTVLSTDLKEQTKSMNVDRLKKNVEFAQKTGFSRTYLWGVEWWYWLEQNNHMEIGEYVKALPKD
jgi:hypothetical protein